MVDLVLDLVRGVRWINSGRWAVDHDLGAMKPALQQRIYAAVYEHLHSCSTVLPEK